MSLAIENLHATIGEFQRLYLYKSVIEMISPQSDPIRNALPNGFDIDKVTSQVDLFNQDAVFPDRKTNSKKFQWSGEFIEIPMEDASTRNATFTYIDDQDQNIYTFFSAAKDMSGNEDNQAAVVGPTGKFNMIIYKVSVDKKTITACRKLVGCKVYGLETDQLRKDGTDISKVKVEIRWDRNQNKKDVIGQEI